MGADPDRGLPPPPTVAFDVAAHLGSPDPYADLARLRGQAPVALVDGGFVVVTGHEAALAVLRSPVCGTAPIAAGYLHALPDGAARDELGHRINFLDAPDHPRVRGLVNKAFTPRRVAALRPWMERLAADLLAGLEGREEVDLLHDFAHQLPSLVISEMLGVPPEDRETLTTFSDRVAPLLSVAPTPEERADAVAAAEEFHAYLGTLLEARRSAPGDDLLSALLTAEEDGERLAHVELLSLAATLYSAGHRTTRDLFTNGMATLLATGPLGEAAPAAWSDEAVVAEFLRHETPTHFVGRVPYEPLEVDGVAIPAMAPVLVFIAAANRDPAVYDDPDEFRPGRDGPAPLSFAFGVHYCLGASLARSEAEVMLGAVRRRWPSLRLSPGSEITWHQRGPFRGVDRLLVHAQT